MSLGGWMRWGSRSLDGTQNNRATEASEATFLSTELLGKPGPRVTT